MPAIPSSKDAVFGQWGQVVRRKWQKMIILPILKQVKRSVNGADLKPPPYIKKSFEAFTSHPALYMVVWLVAKFGMASAFMCCFVYGSEIFPVQYRNICLGFCATISNIGAMMSPHCGLL
ncbi:hypothetical protein NECAME_18176, partial [Necator americanus]